MSGDDEFNEARRHLFRAHDDELAQLKFHSLLERSLRYDSFETFSLEEFLGPAILGPYFIEEGQPLNIEFLCKHFVAWDRNVRHVCRLAILPRAFSRALGVGTDEHTDDPLIKARLSVIDHSWRSCQKLKFKHLCVPYHWGPTESYFVIAMPPVQGISLSVEHLQSSTYQQVVTWLVPILKELDQFHKRGLIHGDIRRDQIFVEGENAKLTGFENRILLSIRPHEAANTPTSVMSALTRPVTSTPPEEWREQNLDGRSDIYQVGLILHEFLAQKPLIDLVDFGEIGTSAVIERLTTQGFPSLKPEPGIPDTLYAIAAKAVSPNRDLRFSAASEFVDALQSVKRS